jgi:hypothetical protein
MIPKSLGQVLLGIATGFGIPLLSVMLLALPNTVGTVQTICFVISVLALVVAAIFLYFTRRRVLAIGISFGVAIWAILVGLDYIVVQSYAHENDVHPVAEPQIVNSDIQTFQQYDSRLSAACNRNKVDRQPFATCAYTLMLNDEMATGSIGILAEQEQAALDEQYAKGMSGTELKAEITSGLQQLTHAFDRELSIQTSTNLIELLRRSLHDTSINKLLSSLEKDSRFGGRAGSGNLNRTISGISA